MYPVSQQPPSHGTNLDGATRQLLQRPKVGRLLDQYLPREVRRIIVGNYEMRYERAESIVYVLRVWHTRGSAN